MEVLRVKCAVITGIGNGIVMAQNNMCLAV